MDTALGVLGAGTVGYWTMKELVTAAPPACPSRVIIVDKKLIRNVNAITCPGYGDHLQEPKAARLAELIPQWSAGRISAEVYHGNVHQFPWARLDPASTGSRVGKVLAVVGLDCWQARMAVAQGLRDLTDGLDMKAVMIQIGLDRGQASVNVFGGTWQDPCPCCGLEALPGPEACALYDSDGRLVRGNLHAEAQAAARLVRRIVSDEMLEADGLSRWVNTKSLLYVPQDAAEPKFVRATRPCEKATTCKYGAHGTSAPMRWEEILETITRRKGERE